MCAGPFTRPIETKWYAQARSSIDHWATINRTYTCPDDYPSVGDLANGGEANAIVNTSSANVSATAGGGGYGQRSLTINFTNWNFTGDQTASINLACHN